LMRLQKGFLGDEEVKKLVARGCLGIHSGVVWMGLFSKL